MNEEIISVTLKLQLLSDPARFKIPKSVASFLNIKDEDTVNFIINGEVFQKNLTSGGEIILGKENYMDDRDVEIEIFNPKINHIDNVDQHGLSRNHRPPKKNFGTLDENIDEDGNINP